MTLIIHQMKMIVNIVYMRALIHISIPVLHDLSFFSHEKKIKPSHSLTTLLTVAW